MNDFDDDLRRLLGDDRLALTPRADAVDRIVKGARRRRATRVAATAAGSVGLVAALTVGSFAVAGQFTAAPEPVQPAETPSVPTDDPTPAPSETPTDAAPVVVYPNEGIDGFTVGTKLADLEGIDGVEITRYAPEDGYSELCYGEYRSPSAHGYISTRGTFGSVPEDLDPYYEVSTMHFDVPVVTPEGITAGSSEAEVLAAYPGAAQFGMADRYRAEFQGEQNIVRAWEFPAVGGVVTEVVMDGLPTCDRVPVLDPPTGGDEGGTEPADPPTSTEPADDPTETPGDNDTPGGGTEAGWRVDGDDVLSPIRLGMTLAELQAVEGVQISTDGGGDGICYGSFTLGTQTGAISVRRDFGSDDPPAPAESDDDYRITYFSTSDPAATTPLGVGPGSTFEQVREAYPDVVTGDTFDAYVPDAGNPAVRWLFVSGDGETVASLGLDAGQNCWG